MYIAKGVLLRGENGVGKESIDFTEHDDRLVWTSGGLYSHFPSHLWSEMGRTSRLGDLHFKNDLIFCIKLNLHLTCSLVIPVLGIYPGEIKVGSHKNLYASVYLY